MLLFGIIFVGVFAIAVGNILKAVVSGSFKNSGNYNAGFDLHQQAHKQATDMHNQMHNQAAHLHNQAHTMATNTFFHM